MGGQFGRGRVLFTLAIATVGCDVEEGRATEPQTSPQGGACEVEAEDLLACTDDDCDLDAHAQALSDCSVGDKTDGQGQSQFGWIEDLQRKLAEKAEACFDAQNTGCLKNVYYALAAGAKVKGMHNAAAMMWNFLQCDYDPATIGADALQADASVAYAMDDARALVWQAGEDMVAQRHGDGHYPVSVPAMSVSADSADIWYAMGRFHVSGEGTVTLEGGAVKYVTISYRATDRYDWHAGLSASGSEAGVSDFQDAWAAYLVDGGVACEFDMIGEWWETVHDSPFGTSPGGSPPDRGDCCQDNGTPGCSDESCEEVVCDHDPLCCSQGWDSACAEAAESFTACRC